MAYYNPITTYPQLGGYQMPYQQQAQQAQNGVIWVQGEAAAKSYLVAPGCTVQLWDSEKKVIYLKSADPRRRTRSRQKETTNRSPHRDDRENEKSEVMTPH